MKHPDNKWKSLEIKINNSIMNFETVMDLSELSIRYDKAKEFFELYWIPFVIFAIHPTTEDRVKHILMNCISLLENDPLTFNKETDNKITVEVIDI